MKIRQGFVSNSSSSSFVIIAREDDHKKVMAALPKFVRDVIVKEFRFKQKELFGQKIIFAAAYNISSEDFPDVARIPEEYEDWTPDQYIDAYEEELKKLGVEYLIDNEGS